MESLFPMLLLFIALKVNATEGNVNRQIFIKPQFSTSECPSISCPTINEVVEHYDDYFTSNTTLNFLSGNHTITNQSSIVVTDVEYLTLVGSEDSVIQCSGEFSFTFFNITTLNISRLNFSGCVAELPNNAKLQKYTEDLEVYPGSYSSEYMILYLFSASIFVIETQEVILNNATAYDIEYGESFGCILCFNVLSAFLSDMSFVRTTLTLVYTDSHMSNNDSVAHAKLSNVNFNYTKFAYDRTAIYAIIDAKRFPVIVELDNVTVASSVSVSFTNGYVELYRASVNFIISHSSNFKLHASHLTLVEIEELSVTTASCEQADTTVTVYFEHVRIESETKFSLCGLIDATIRDMRVYNTTGTSIRIENSIVAFNKTYITSNSESTLIESESTYTIKCKSSNVSFYGSTQISHNRAYSTIDISNSTVLFSGNVEFTNNTSTGNAGAITASKESIIILQGSIRFIRNRGYHSGAIEATGKSIINFQGNINFTGNSGDSGGAIGLYQDSYFLLHSSTYILFESNTAQQDGGAIYIRVGPNRFTQTPVDWIDSSFKDLNSQCFFTRNGYYKEVQVIFDNNTAGNSGVDIYGGFIDTCTMPKSNEFGSFTFNEVFIFKSKNSITSDPTRVCLCDYMRPNCYNVLHEVQVFPGQEFSISVAAVGQYNGPTPGTVYAEIRDIENHHSQFIKLPAFQKANLINGSCTELSYTPFSQNKNATLILTIKPNNPAFSEQEIRRIVNNALGKSFFVLPVHVTITFKDCPLGFVLKEGSCICSELIEKNKLSCDIDTQTVHKNNKMWIGTVQVKNISEVIVVHDHCPFDYCNQNKTDINLARQDEQCALNHAGTLCGKCRANFSNVLGTSNCELCDNTMIVLLPVFMICGVVLVILLLHLNLTVSVGTINGLIFYANIVQANRATFFPNTQSFLSIFIAWLNLDFGIKTCFYNGLDTYTKTWLQFAFPLYIWLLVIVMIVWSHYSTTGTKLVGNNAVFALATLFLISYAKLVRNIVAVLSFTVLQLPNSTRVVWLYDANIEYFSAKHAPLFVAAVGVLLFISVPYTALLIFVQCLFGSHKRSFRWVKRIMPLLDAYTGPYKDRHRYWIGLLLLVRVILFLTFSANVLGDPETNLLAIILIVSGILCYKIYIHGAYKSKGLTMLETLFHFKLLAISAVRLYPLGEQSHLIATNFFVSIIFATFCCIIIYHTYLAIKSLRRGEALIQTVLVWCRIKKDSVTQKLTLRCVKRGASEDNDERDEQPAGDQVTQAAQIPTTTTIEIREPLLASQEYTN